MTSRRDGRPAIDKRANDLGTLRRCRSFLDKDRSQNLCDLKIQEGIGHVARLITTFSIVAAAFWTLLSLGVWAAVEIGGDLLYASIDWLFAGNREFVAVVGSLIRFVQGLGVGLILVIWLLGCVAIGAIGLFLRRVALQLEVGPPDPLWDARSVWSDQPRPMKDVTPSRDRLPPPQD